MAAEAGVARKRYEAGPVYSAEQRRELVEAYTAVRGDREGRGQLLARYKISSAYIRRWRKEPRVRTITPHPLYSVEDRRVLVRAFDSLAGDPVGRRELLARYDVRPEYISRWRRRFVEGEGDAPPGVKSERRGRGKGRASGASERRQVSAGVITTSG